MMMMMMMMVFLQSKLSCDECFFLTCRRVVFCHSRKRSKEDWEKNTTDTWGGKKNRNSRRDEQQWQQRKRGRARTTGETMYILIRDTKTNTFSHYKKFFFKLFYKKKNLRESLGEETQALPPFTSQPSSGGLFISTYDVYINQPHFSLISSEQLFFSLKRGKRTV